VTERFKYSFNLWFYMKSRSKRLGLAGLALGGAMAVSGCVSVADKLYSEGSINRHQYLLMKQEEDRQNLGLTLGLFGAGFGAKGVQNGNLNTAYAGRALVDLGAAQVGANNTNVYVGENSFVNRSETSNNLSEKPVLFTYSKWVDKDNNKSIDFSEIEGEKDVFATNEGFIAGAYFPTIQTHLELRVINEQGNVVKLKKFGNGDVAHSYFNFFEVDGNVSDWSEKLAPGKYRVAVSNLSKVLCEKNISIESR